MMIRHTFHTAGSFGTEQVVWEIVPMQKISGQPPKITIQKLQAQQYA